MKVCVSCGGPATRPSYVEGEWYCEGCAGDEAGLILGRGRRQRRQDRKMLKRNGVMVPPRGRKKDRLRKHRKQVRRLRRGTRR